MEIENLQKELSSTRTLLESANSIIIRWDNQGVIRYINEFGLLFFGYSQEELLNQSVMMIVPNIEGHTGREMTELINNVLRFPDQNTNVLNENIRKDGKSVWVNWTNKAIFDEQGDVQEILAIGNDITAQKEAQDALRASEKRFRTLYRSMIQSMALHEIICDDDGNPVDYRFLDVNPAFENLLGKTAKEIIGKTVLEILPKTEAHWIETYGKVALGGEPYHFENYSKELDRHFDVVSYSPEKAQFVVIVTDITAHVRMREKSRELEEKMFQAQKLESLGVLAGGIAHDFNNILMSVMGNANLAMKRLAAESPAMENIRQIDSATSRAAELARQMLAYSGKGSFVVETLNIDKLVQEMIHILQVSISKHAVLRFNFNPNLPAVDVDATQLRQVIMNLVINASEAIGERSGVIAISTGAMDCDRDYLQSTYLDEELTEGLYVFFEVADTGCGMDRYTLDHMFDPFFSTKFTGRGLGMAAVLGIVRGHKGAVKAYSEVDKGTTFKVLLPASTRPETLYDLQNPEMVWQGDGTILLVDDEESVRAICKDMLQDLGLDVITASDGREALKLFQENRDQISGVLMDMTMPHMDGEQAFRELRRIDPTIKIIMASGYNEQEISQKFLGKGLSGFIQKPYCISKLAETLHSLVERR
jgi:PAS domain S-box-containing protein